MYQRSPRSADWIVCWYRTTTVKKRRKKRLSKRKRIEFIHLIASEANDICDKETKKTIAGEHVVSALKALGFEEYVEDVEEVYKEHRQQQKVW